MTTVRQRDEERLARVGSESRAAVLAEIANEASPKYARELLAEWFNVCDALAPWTDELRTAFERAGYVTDTDEELTLPCTVYRAAWEDDEDVERALSWTTERATAEFFARYLTGMRAWWLGIRREDADPAIFRGTCTRAYGYLSGRDEHEVIAAEVIDVEPIAKLIRVPKEGR